MVVQKAFPKKNIRDLLGKPLIQYTIEAALLSKNVDRIVLSTDDDDIARVAEQCGCEVPFMRPPELAQDNSAHLDCITHALDVLRDREGYEPDYVLLLQPTSPLRTAQDIDDAIAIMLRTSCDLVVSVCEEQVNLSKFSYVDRSEVLLPFAESTANSSYIPRQELAPTYRENGAIYLQRTSTLRSPPQQSCNFGSLRSNDQRAYIMPKHRSLDVDTPFDLHLASLLLRDPFSSGL